METNGVMEALGGGAGAALIGALTGTFGLELIRAWLKRGEARDSLSHTLREELRADLGRLREEMDSRDATSSARLKALEAQVEDWRAKYYDLLTQYHTLRVEHKALALELAAMKVTQGDDG